MGKTAVRTAVAEGAADGVVRQYGYFSALHQSLAVGVMHDFPGPGLGNFPSNAPVVGKAQAGVEGFLAVTDHSATVARPQIDVFHGIDEGFGFVEQEIFGPAFGYIPWMVLL